MHIDWQQDWATIPTDHDCGLGSRTHGVAVLRNAEVVVFSQSSPAVHFFDSAGRLIRAWGESLGGAHGLTHVVEGDDEFLWLTDQESGEVSKRDLKGKVHQVIAAPPASDGAYSPTSVAVCLDGDIWVADGYGSNIVRRYSRQGELIGTLTGVEGPGRFARPHGIAFAPDGNLYVADRRNKRILVYDLHGIYLFHRDNLAHSPCGFAFQENSVFIPELFGDLKELDPALNHVASYGTNTEVRPEAGWPGIEGWGWPTLAGWPDKVDASAVKPRTFISPHACAVTPDRTIYVVEWRSGGSIVRLKQNVVSPDGLLPRSR